MRDAVSRVVDAPDLCQCLAQGIGRDGGRGPAASWAPAATIKVVFGQRPAVGGDGIKRRQKTLRFPRRRLASALVDRGQRGLVTGQHLDPESLIVLHGVL